MIPLVASSGRGRAGRAVRGQERLVTLATLSMCGVRTPSVRVFWRIKLETYSFRAVATPFYPRILPMPGILPVPGVK